jgi:phosphohistidine phosphatase SixA
MSFFSKLRAFFTDHEEQSDEVKCLRLILMRTGSSFLLSSPDSPLNKQGIKETRFVAEQFAKEDWVPELVLCSNAKRTRETWKLVEQALNSESMIRLRVTEELCLVGGDEAALELIGRQSSRIRTLMIVGHSPVLQRMVNRFCGERILFWTSDVALLETDSVSWAEAINQKGEWRLMKRILAGGTDTFGLSRLEPEYENLVWESATRMFP